jgi:hypothetical protein
MFENLLRAASRAATISRPAMAALPLAAAALLWPSLAAGATIETRKGSRDMFVVLVKGKMVAGDIDTFRTKTAGVQNAIVIFHSDGGHLVAGIEIGKMIRLKNYLTAVPAGARCASACAVAWLGGTRRFLEGNARIGFHAASIVRSGQASETGVGNALLGSYLGQLGLPEQAIVYITKAAPNSMTWLDLREANQRGIFVARLGDKPRAETTASAPAKPQVQQAQQAQPETPAGRALTPQQAKMKDCGAKWQEHKKANNVKGQDEYRKFLRECLKS